MGIKTVAVYSEADSRALHVQQADEVSVGCGSLSMCLLRLCGTCGGMRERRRAFTFVVVPGGGRPTPARPPRAAGGRGEVFGVLHAYVVFELNEWMDVVCRVGGRAGRLSIVVCVCAVCCACGICPRCEDLSPRAHWGATCPLLAPPSSTYSPLLTPTESRALGTLRRSASARRRRSRVTSPSPRSSRPSRPRGRRRCVRACVSVCVCE